jgi:hypothetical protein
MGRITADQGGSTQDPTKSLTKRKKAGGQEESALAHDQSPTMRARGQRIRALDMQGMTPLLGVERSTTLSDRSVSGEGDGASNESHARAVACQLEPRQAWTGQGLGGAGLPCADRCEISPGYSSVCNRIGDDARCGHHAARICWPSMASGAFWCFVDRWPIRHALDPSLGTNREASGFRRSKLFGCLRVGEWKGIRRRVFALVRRVVRIDNDLIFKPGFEAGSLAEGVKHAMWNWVDGIHENNIISSKSSEKRPVVSRKMPKILGSDYIGRVGEKWDNRQTHSRREHKVPSA